MQTRKEGAMNLGEREFTQNEKRRPHEEERYRKEGTRESYRGNGMSYNIYTRWRRISIHYGW
jgi:hypothetical protein